MEIGSVQPKWRIVATERERARLFDRQAERYDRSRPAYPDALIDEVVGVRPGRLSVLDVACGTGIASRQIRDRGTRVFGVELNAGMAAIARRHGIPTEVTAFETWDAAGRTFDIVTCAQAWHWLEPHASLEKVASVLEHGGRLCLFWNVGRYPDDLGDALQSGYSRALPQRHELVIGCAAKRSGDPTIAFNSVADGLRACDTLAAPQIKSFPWSRTYTRDQWLDELQTHSDHAALPAEERHTLLDEIGKTIDDFGGAFDMAYAAILISATRK